MVFQDPENQMVTTDVEREIAFGLENLGTAPNLIARRIEEALDTTGICHLRHRQIHDLSGGEKQKTAIASILALHPEILILDEPTSELDPQSAEEVLTIVKRLNEDLGITVIIIEHRLERVLPYADRLMVFNRGRIICDGQPRKVLNEDYERILESGTGLPPVVRLTHMLKEKGRLDNGGTPLTVKEGRLRLKEALEESTPRPPQRQSKTFNESVIEVEKLRYTYPEGPTALEDVTLKIHRGVFTAVMGRNASGKTTLVRHFNGLLKPGGGKVMVKGTDTRKSTTAQLARTVGFVSQNPNDHLFAETVEEEIGFALKNLGFAQEEISKRVEQAIKQFKLEEYRRQYPRSLSGGEKQRVALASVMAVEPQVLVLAEPPRGMEYRLKRELMDFLSEYTRQGNSVVLVTHVRGTAAEQADRVILMSEGKIVMDGSKHEALSRALLFSPQINGWCSRSGAGGSRGHPDSGRADAGTGMKKSYVCLLLIVLTGAAAILQPVLFPSLEGSLPAWGTAATVIAVLAILAFFFQFEAAAVSSKEIALVAMLGTISAAARIPFAAIPNVQPCTFLIICSGYVFGPVAGFMVGAITALVSNFFLGQGPWTPFQMLAWGLAGISAAYLRRLAPGRINFDIVRHHLGLCVRLDNENLVLGLTGYPLTWKTFLIYQATACGSTPSTR
jgi:energy-coupling factor transport system ATP-binding protein